MFIKCFTFYKGGWVVGNLVKHNVKESRCLVETKLFGTVKVKSSRVVLMNRPEE